MRAFISYSHQDGDSLARLHVHLASLRREGLIEAWFDREILAGDEIDHEIETELSAASLFLLLLSPDFLASDYCVDREMRMALERHDAGTARVVPIVVQPCDWMSNQALRRLKALPKDGKPISEWTNANNAYLSVAEELRRVVTAEQSARNSAEGTAPDVSGAAAVGSRRYRIKRDFDNIDRVEYRDIAFTKIKDYFYDAANEINNIENLRAQFDEISSKAFICTVINRGRDRGVAHITVHRGSSDSMLGDIFYSFKENASENEANGGFNVAADEYEQYLEDFGLSLIQGSRLGPETAAERLWAKFVEHAGITYD